MRTEGRRLAEAVGRQGRNRGCANTATLLELGRLTWLAEEVATRQDTIERSMSHERWRRVSGNAALDAAGLAIIRELFHWRDAEAQRRNQPARRIPA